MTKDVLDMDLQMFGEDENNSDDNSGSGEKTVTVSELKRRVENEKAKADEEIQRLKESQEEAIQEAIEKFKAENTMDKKEREEFLKKQQEEKEQEYQNRIAELEREKTQRELKDEAINTLSERNLPVSSEVLNLVVKDNAEDTSQAIDEISKIIKGVKNEFENSEKPLTSGGGSTGENTSPNKILSDAKITDF